MSLTPTNATKIEGAGTSATVAVDATAGSSLLVGIASYTATNSGVIGSTRTGDSYGTIAEGDTSNGAYRSHFGIRFASGVAGGSVNLTASCTNGSGVAAYAMEVPSALVKDVDSPAALNGNSGSPTTNSLTNATLAALYFAVMANESPNNAAVTSSGSWSQTVNGVTMTETDGTSWPVVGCQFQVVASSAGRTGSWTADSQNWGGLIAVFAASGGTVTTTAAWSATAAVVIGAATVTLASTLASFAVAVFGIGSASVTGDQTAVPVSLVANPGLWTDDLGSSLAADLVAAVAIAGGRYLLSPALGVGGSASITFHVGTLSTPGAGTRTIRLTPAKDAALGTVNFLINLRQGQVGGGGAIVQAFSGGTLANVDTTDNEVDLTETSDPPDWSNLDVEIVAEQTA